MRPLARILIPKNLNAVQWGEDGKSFIVRDKKLFAKLLPGKYTNDYSAFQEALRKRGFHITYNQEDESETYQEALFNAIPEACIADNLLRKLYQAVSDKDNHIAMWTPCGQRFTICDGQMFIKKILLTSTCGKTIKLFLKHMEDFGFEVTNDTATCGHRYFVPEHPDDIVYIKNTTRKQNCPRKSTNQKNKAKYKAKNKAKAKQMKTHTGNLQTNQQQQRKKRKALKETLAKNAVKSNKSTDLPTNKSQNAGHQRKLHFMPSSVLNQNLKISRTYPNQDHANTNISEPQTTSMQETWAISPCATSSQTEIYPKRIKRNGTELQFNLSPRPNHPTSEISDNTSDPFPENIESETNLGISENDQQDSASIFNQGVDTLSANPDYQLQNCISSPESFNSDAASNKPAGNHPNLDFNYFNYFNDSDDFNNLFAGF